MGRLCTLKARGVKLGKNDAILDGGSAKKIGNSARASSI
jgi:hypothetical protein